MGEIIPVTWTFEVDAAAAALVDPGLFVSPNQRIIIPTTGRHAVTAGYPIDKTQWNADLLAFSAVLLNSGLEIVTGWFLELGLIIGDQYHIHSLETGVQSCVEIASWTGRVPLNYGFCVAFLDQLLITNLVVISALLEVRE